VDDGRGNEQAGRPVDEQPRLVSEADEVRDARQGDDDERREPEQRQHAQPIADLTHALARRCPYQKDVRNE